MAFTFGHGQYPGVESHSFTFGHAQYPGVVRPVGQERRLSVRILVEFYLGRLWVDGQPVVRVVAFSVPAPRHDTTRPKCYLRPLVGELLRRFR